MGWGGGGGGAGLGCGGGGGLVGSASQREERLENPGLGKQGDAEVGF